MAYQVWLRLDTWIVYDGGLSRVGLVGPRSSITLAYITASGQKSARCTKSDSVWAQKPGLVSDIGARQTTKEQQVLLHRTVKVTLT